MTFYPHLFWVVDHDEYNCSGRTVEEWTTMGVRRSLIGIYYIIYGTIICTLYLVIILAMSNKTVLSKCCYKLMYYNCFYDLAVWCGTCINCINIGINRFCTIFGIGSDIFEGRRCFYWMSFPFFYTLFVLFLTRPVVFHSQFGAWLLTPLINDFSTEVEVYRNNVMLITNLLTSTLLSFLYLAITCKLFCNKKVAIYRRQLSKAQYKICLQSGLICGMTSLCAFLYSYMQIFPVPQEMVLLTHIFYQYCTGLQCFVYLCMNQAVRQGVAKLLIQMPIPSTLLNISSLRDN